MARTCLYWKYEAGCLEGETPRGPAWIDHFQDDGKLSDSAQVAEGEWIARDEAIRLARENAYELFLDE